MIGDAYTAPEIVAKIEELKLWRRHIVRRLKRECLSVSERDQLNRALAYHNSALDRLHKQYWSLTNP